MRGGRGEVRGGRGEGGGSFNGSEDRVQAFESKTHFNLT